MSKKHKKTSIDLKQCTYYIDGMHCASCEVLIEKKLLKENNVESVDASLADGKVDITYKGERPSYQDLTRLFREQEYLFSGRKFNSHKGPMLALKDGVISVNPEKFNRFLMAMGIVLLLLITFFIIDKSGFASLMTVTGTSSLPAFFVFGLLAGASSCAALVGGLLLSLSKQWSEVYIASESKYEKAKPFIMFNIGRLLSFVLLGGVLGAIGGALGISYTSSSTFTAIVIIAVSLMMLLLALQMLGVEWASKFQFRLPKFVTKGIADEENFQGKYMPAVVGFLTFFLPCGFTIVAQGLALASGSFFTGAAMMLFFALGTLPTLALISFSSVGLSSKPKLSWFFNTVSGFIVLFFALYNMNAQVNVLGLPSLSDVKLPTFAQSDSNQNLKTTSVDQGDYQTLRIQASSNGYSPQESIVKAGKPIKWEIEDVGASGCASGIISKDLGDISVTLKRGLNTVDIASLEPGLYKYSCWMGMFTGTIRAI